MMPPTPTMAMAVGERRGASGELDDDVARQLDALLQDNVVAISTMRANLLSGNPDDNAPQMARFHDNYQAVMSTCVPDCDPDTERGTRQHEPSGLTRAYGGPCITRLGGACVSVPPLPVRPDASLLSVTRESNGDQQDTK